MKCDPGRSACGCELLRAKTDLLPAERTRISGDQQSAQTPSPPQMDAVQHIEDHPQAHDVLDQPKTQVHTLFALASCFVSRYRQCLHLILAVSARSSAFQVFALYN